MTAMHRKECVPPTGNYVCIVQLGTQGLSASGNASIDRPTAYNTLNAFIERRAGSRLATTCALRDLGSQATQCYRRQGTQRQMPHHQPLSCSKNCNSGEFRISHCPW
jgi:hypothetical protein